MASPPKKLFITGATGYIGSAVLSNITKTIPNLEITALLRVPTPTFLAAYPKITIIRGTFDSFDIIAAAAAETDIVLHAGDSDNAGCANAIISGLKTRALDTSRGPAYLIHLSGTGLVADLPRIYPSQTWEGKENPRVWNDVRDIQELYDLPPDAFHHTIDVAMQDLTASTGGRIRTAIVCPPDIYGQPEGVTERATHMVPNYVRVVLEKGTGGFYLGSGQNYRAVSHLSDVSQLFALIVGEALKPDGGKATWGKEGFYFGVASEVRWKEAAEAIQKILVKQGLVDPNAEVESWPKEKFVGLLPQLESWFPEITLYFWGSNSRAVSERATNLLGWEARGPTFFEALEADVLVVVDEINKSKGKL